MHILIGEALEANAMGNQVVRGGDVKIGEVEGEAVTYNDYFNESSDEGSYVESSEEEDYVDSDFMTDEEDEEEDEEAEQEVREQEKIEKRKAKKSAYLDPAKRAKSIKSTDSDSDEDDAASKTSRGGRRKTSSETAGAKTDRSFRSSTTLRSEASKSAASEAAQRKQEQVKSKSSADERRLTQEELLEEAKATAMENEKDLQRLVQIEEDMKKIEWKKSPLTGPRIITLLRKDADLITFTDPSCSPYLWHNSSPPTPPSKIPCVVTGQPAKYRDPKTGQPFATCEAFKKLRDKYK